MQIVTGYEGQPHVTAWQDRDLNQGVFGPDTYILGVGSKLAATIISNNTIHIADGSLVLQGCQGCIQKGTYDTISIDNGTQGMQRRDLIVAQYSRNGSTGVEEMSLVVIKGTAAASNPSDPAYTTGDIQNGDTLVQVPIYRVVLNGLSITSVDRLVDEIGNIADGGGSTTVINGTASLPSSAIYTNIRSEVLAPGTYIVSSHILIEDDVPTLKSMIVIGNEAYGGGLVAPSQYECHSTITALIELSTTKTLSLRATQGGGETYSCTYKIVYKKVG